MRKIKCRARYCQDEGTHPLRKRIGLSFYCEEHFEEMKKKRTKLLIKKMEKQK